MADVPIAFARHQRATLRGMGELAAIGLVPRPLRRIGRLLERAPEPPGEWIERRVAPLPDALIDAYAEHVGAARGAYAGTVPPHLFPQWAFAMSGALMRGLDLPMLRAINGGCRLEVRGELPRGRELVVRGRLAAIDDDGRRAVITQRFVTGVDGAAQLVIAEVRVFVPLAAKKGGDREKTTKKAATRAEIEGAPTIGTFEVGRRAGWELALLTGDFNPIHWARPWARASGFRDVILHGFGTFARAWEIARQDAGGALAEMDARFVRPLVLPASARVVRAGERLAVIDARDVTVMEATLTDAMPDARAPDAPVPERGEDR